MTLSRQALIARYLQLHGSAAMARTRMLAALLRVAAAPASARGALAATLAGTATGRLDAGASEWTERIEAERLRLTSRERHIRAGFAPAPPDRSDWMAHFQGEIELSNLAKLFSIPPLWGGFLLRLTRALQARSCLELGTGLGISAAYQAAGMELNGGGRLITLEAASEFGAIAEGGLERLGLVDRVDIRLGQIDETLPGAAADAAPIDFALIDAEHQEEPLLGYVEEIERHLAPGALIAVDDIGFPSEMRSGWRSVRARPGVVAAFNLGRVGVVAHR